jgi:hypothetical protein
MAMTLLELGDVEAAERWLGLAAAARRSPRRGHVPAS